MGINGISLPLTFALLRSSPIKPCPRTMLASVRRTLIIMISSVDMVGNNDMISRRVASSWLLRRETGTEVIVESCVEWERRKQKRVPGLNAFGITQKWRWVDGNLRWNGSGLLYDRCDPWPLSRNSIRRRIMLRSYPPLDKEFPWENGGAYTYAVMQIL